MNINDIVNAEINVLTELDNLLDEEKIVLVKNDAKELPEIIEKKKLIAKKISILEIERKKIYGEKKGEELVEEGIFNKELFNKLKKLSFSVKEKGETNFILTKQSLSYIKVITSALAPPKRIVTYGNNGKLDDNLDRSAFTTKV